jgi:5-methylcytosine-specific restriction protein A
METRSICPAPGCNRITSGGRCDQHKSNRGTSKNRPGDPFYSSARWRKLRAAKLAADPLCECEECKAIGAITAADTVDHVKARIEYPELAFEWSNLASMHSDHHNRKTRREVAARRRQP